MASKTLKARGLDQVFTIAPAGTDDWGQPVYTASTKKSTAQVTDCGDHRWKCAECGCLTHTYSPSACEHIWATRRALGAAVV